MLSLINARRARAGLRALRASSCADAYAERWSPTIARRDGLYHQSMGTLTSGCGTRYAGENVGWYTTGSASRLFALFMGSPPHAANILSSRFTSVGIGAYIGSDGRWWVTQDFLG